MKPIWMKVADARKTKGTFYARRDTLMDRVDALKADQNQMDLKILSFKGMSNKWKYKIQNTHFIFEK